MIESWIAFTNLPALQTINAFNALETTYNFNISNTNYFNDLDAFESLTSVVTINIHNNNALSDCCIVSQFVSTETIWDDINIHSNAVGCNSYYESYNSCIEEKCPEGDLTFTSQAEIDQFIIDYPYCAEIEGNLEISPSNNSISNLNGLQNLTLITGNLSISGSDIVDLSGFDNLYFVGGDFTVADNMALDSIDALNGLNYIGGSLTLADNSSLSACCAIFEIQNAVEGAIDVNNNADGCNSLAQIVELCTPTCPSGNLYFTSQAQVNGFLSTYPNCTQVTGNLLLSGMDITNLNGLINLDTIYGYVKILNNPLLNDMSGLTNLSYVENELHIIDNAIEEVDSNYFTSLGFVGGEIYIHNNSNLTSIAGFPSIVELGVLSIQENHFLEDFDAFNNLVTISDITFNLLDSLQIIGGFSNLQNVTGNLQLSTLPMLTDISFLANIQNNDNQFIQNLVLVGNTSLEDCCIVDDMIFDVIFPANITLSNNAFGCNSLSEIDDYCAPPCPQSSIYFFTQSDVDQFIIDYPDCTEFNESLYVLDTSSISNLNGLANLKIIHNSFIIYNGNQLTSLDGINGLEHVGYFTISNCPLITSINGFENMLSSNAISIRGCNSLTEINGFENISGLNSALSFVDNPLLTTISAFSNTTDLDYFRIENCESLSDLSFLSSIESVENILTIDNSGAVNLDFFSNLNEIKYLFIRNNEQLVNIDGLNNLSVISQDIEIVGNSQLSNCCVLEDLPLSVIFSDLLVENNATGCNSITEIEEFCEPIVMGCMDITACNYNANANVEDGNCIYATGCDVCDGNGGLIDNLEVGEACDDGDETTMNDKIQADCSCVGTTIVTGCTDATACNYNANANVDDGTCIYATGCDICDGNGGLIDNLEVGQACDDGDETTMDDTIQAYCSCAGIPIVMGCMDVVACNFDANANVDDGSCIYATGCDICDDQGGLIDNLEIGQACDDGNTTTTNDTVQADCSCVGAPIVMGCMSVTACNYNANANVDDGSCFYATGCDICDGQGGVINNLEVGEACDDGNENTINDAIQEDCSCAGTLVCPTGDVLISNQTDLLQFIENYTYCTEVFGNLIINGNAVTDLGFLQNISSISGSCAIVSTSLSNLSGLDNLTYIGGDLQILSNPMLQSMDALANVNFIGYDLSIESNISLTTCCSVLDLIETTNNQYFIQNNATPCQSFNVIESTCLVNSTEILNEAEKDLLVTINANHLGIQFETGIENWNAIVYDIKGRLLHQSKLPLQQNKHQINISNLPIGTYFLVVQDGENLMTTKFIKK